jgi:flagellar hook-associated protein 2
MATDLISALGAGSGVDVKALAQSLVDAEKVPREQAINTKIDDQARRVSGYSALMLSLETLKTSFQKLNDKTDFNAAQVGVSDATVIAATTSATAVPGRHTIEVTQLAAPQRSVMGGFSSATEALNSGAAFSVRLTLDGTAQSSVDVLTATPQGVVDAINASGQGVTAQLVDTGDGTTTAFKIVLTGPTGADGVYSFSSDDDSGTAQTDLLTFGAATTAGDIAVAGVSVTLAAGDTADEVAVKVRTALLADDFMTGNPGRSLVTNGDGSLSLIWDKDDGAATAAVFVDADSTGVTMSSTTTVAYVAGTAVDAVALDATDLQSAADAIVEVNGLTITRSSNILDDAIPGVFMDLLSAAPGTVVDLRVTRDTTAIKDNINALVDAYNAAVSDLAILTGERSDDPEDVYSGSLAGDSTVQRIKSQMRSMFLSTSTTPSGDITALRDIGLEIDRQGVLSITDAKLTAALTSNFDDVVTMLSAGTNNQSEIGDDGRGVAGEAVKQINALISSRGTIATQSANATTRSSEYQAQLEKLNTRMEALLARYTKQFAAMETMVGQTNSMRDSLTASFDGMMAMYTSK